MNLVQLVADGKPGGGTTVVLELMRALAERHGLRATLVSEPASYALDEAARLGFRTLPLDLWRGGRLDRTAPRRLAEVLRPLRPDLVHAHGGRAGLALARIPATKRTHFAYTVHGYHFPRKPLTARLLGAAAEALIHARAAATVWVSAFDRATARRWHLDRARPLDRVIVNGIDFASLPPPAPVQPHRVGFLGRLHPQKNPLLLPAILAALPAGFRMVVVGGGELEEAVRTRARELGVDDRLEITGALPRDAALRALAGSPTVLLPSAWEALPVALVEAMHLGAVPIAARVGGIPELVEDGISGVLVDGHEPAAYAHAVLALDAAPARRDRLAVAAAERAHAIYALERMADMHASLYRELVDRPSPAE